MVRARGARRREREGLFFISLKALPLCTTPAEVFILFSENFPPPTPNMDRDLSAKLSGRCKFCQSPEIYGSHTLSQNRQRAAKIIHAEPLNIPQTLIGRQNVSPESGRVPIIIF